MKLSIKTILNQILALYKKYFKEVLIVSLLSLLISLVQLYMDKTYNLDHQMNSLSLLAPLFFMLVDTYIYGVFILYIASHESKATESLKKIAKRTLNRLFPLFITSILLFVIVVVGLILLVIPGLIFAAMFALAMYFVLLADKGPIEALILSKKVTQSHRMSLFLLIFLYFFVLIALSTTRQFLPDYIAMTLTRLFAVSSYFGGYLIYKKLAPKRRTVKEA